MTPYGGRDPSQHWFRQWLGAWRHQAISWTNVDLSSVRSGDIHLTANSQAITQLSITDIIWKIKYLKFHSNFPGANDLTNMDFKHRIFFTVQVHAPTWLVVTPDINDLTHWGRVTHICVSILTITGSDNGLSPERHQANVCTNAGILLIGTLETNFSEILHFNSRKCIWKHCLRNGGHFVSASMC